MATTYSISREAAERLADEFYAMTPEEKAEYPEMKGVADHLRKDSLFYGRVLVCIRDEDCIPYPGASDMCKAGEVFTDTGNRHIISDGYGARV